MADQIKRSPLPGTSIGPETTNSKWHLFVHDLEGAVQDNPLTKLLSTPLGMMIAGLIEPGGLRGGMGMPSNLGDAALRSHLDPAVMQQMEAYKAAPVPGSMAEFSPVGSEPPRSYPTFKSPSAGPPRKRTP